MLLADWFKCLSHEKGLEFTQTGTSEQGFTVGPPNAFHVTAHFMGEPPFLRFVASDASRQNLVDEIAAKAIGYVDRPDCGGLVWYSTKLNEVQLGLSPLSFMDSLLQRLGSQTGILGWRRLGANILLEFVEETPEGPVPSKPLLAPKCVVNVHIAAPGPCAGHFSPHIAHGVVETVGAISTFALAYSAPVTDAPISSQP